MTWNGVFIFELEVNMVWNENTKETKLFTAKIIEDRIRQSVIILLTSYNDDFVSSFSFVIKVENNLNF